MALSESKRFPLLYRTCYSESIGNPARLALLKKYGWKKVAMMVQNEELFTLVSQRIYATLHPNYILSHAVIGGKWSRGTFSADRSVSCAVLLLGYKTNKLLGSLEYRLIMSLDGPWSSEYHLCPRSIASRSTVLFSGHFSSSGIISRYPSRQKEFLY